MVPVEKRSLALTTTLVRSAVLKPSRLTESLYVSGRTIVKMKRPSASVVVVSVDPCVRLFNVTATPGSTPPCASWTVPHTEALVDCA